jgi:acyl carrier protein
LVIALEEEFKLELSDEKAEKIWSPLEAVVAIKESLLARQ